MKFTIHAGTLNKTDQKRQEVLDRLAAFILKEGLSASSLRPLAKAAKTSDRMLLYYFEDKADVISASLEHILSGLVVMLEEHTALEPLPTKKLQSRLEALLLEDKMWPYMSLWLEIASLSAKGDKFYADVGEQIGRGLLDWVKQQLKSKNAKARDAEAADLLVTIEGKVLLKCIGMQDVYG